MSNDNFYSQTILIGKRILNPEYKEQEVDEYKNNPCIEALPPIFDDDEITEELFVDIKIKEEEKDARSNVRYHFINRVKDFFLPLDCHYKLEHTLSSMIRRGYIARNPMSKEFVMRINLLVKVRELLDSDKNINPNELFRILAESFEDIPEAKRSTAECASIIGVSGEGKSVSTERLLLMYPQVIHHHLYKGAALTRTQIIWLKIDCPHDGSLKTLCKNYFKALDAVLGNTQYFKMFGSNKNSTATMMILMAHLACLHSIGVLVIDEIQHMIHPKSNPDELLNFFVTLINTIGISILFIGTPKIWDTLGKGLRNVRRFTESGCGSWYRKSEDDEEWNYLVDVMWEYQWLKRFTPLTNNIRKCLYYHSQGIIAVLKALYILAQKQAIFNGSEKLTVELFNETASEDLKPLQKLIESIRENKGREIEDYEDIDININTLLQNQQSRYNLKRKIQEAAQRKVQSIREKTDTLKGLVLGEFAAIQIFKKLSEKQLDSIINSAINQVGTDGEISEIKKIALYQGLLEEEKLNTNNTKMKNNCQKSVKLLNSDLRKLFIQANNENKHIYEILSESGYIKEPINDFVLNGVNATYLNLK